MEESRTKTTTCCTVLTELNQHILLLQSQGCFVVKINSSKCNNKNILYMFCLSSLKSTVYVLNVCN